MKLLVNFNIRCFEKEEVDAVSKESFMPLYKIPCLCQGAISALFTCNKYVEYEYLS